MSNGIIYIKISRKDTQGRDNTNSLQGLTNLRVKFNDVGIINYPIVNITEFPTYYLYKISPTDNTSSIDNNVLNHSFSASALLNPLNQTLPPGVTFLTETYNVNLDVLNYFNSSTSEYVLGDTPNILINYTSSLSISNTNGTQSIAFRLVENNSNTRIANFNYSISSSNQTIYLSGSTNSLIETNRLILEINNSSADNVVISNIQWLITQSQLPNSSSDLTIFEPYLSASFAYSDCDVLMNNVSENQLSTRRREVLYDTGMLIPSNYQQILSQSAEFAEINDYNYTSRAQIIPRYLGNELIQQNENVWTSGDSSFGKTPSVQTIVDKFAVFDWIGGTDYEIRSNGGGIHITDLVESDGNRIGLTGNNQNLQTVEQLFKAGKTVNIYYSTSSIGSRLLTASIFDGGANYDTIFASSASFTLFVRSGQGSGTTFTSQTVPYFIFSGSQQESNVISASYQWADIFDKGIGFKIGTAWGSASGVLGENDNLFPSKPYDFIRFFPFSSIDNFKILQQYTGSQNLERRILSQSNDGTNFYFYLDMPITASIFPSASNDQGFRVYRRIPNENFVYVNIYQPGKGLLIPYNYDPNLDYIQIARKAGIL